MAAKVKKKVKKRKAVRKSTPKKKAMKKVSNDAPGIMQSYFQSLSYCQGFDG